MPATHSNSGAEHPCPERSDRGTEKNMDNTGDLGRWQRDRLKPATSCKDPERSRSSGSIPTFKI